MRLGSRPYDPPPCSLRHFRRPPAVTVAQPPTTSSVVRPISGLQITFLEFRRRHVTTKDRCCAAHTSYHRFLRSSPQRAGVLRSGRRPRRRNSGVNRWPGRPHPRSRATWHNKLLLRNPLLKAAASRICRSSCARRAGGEDAEHHGLRTISRRHPPCHCALAPQSSAYRHEKAHRLTQGWMGGAFS